MPVLPSYRNQSIDLHPHIETSQLICCANQLTGFYMRATLALNGLTIAFQTSINFWSKKRDIKLTTFAKVLNILQELCTYLADKN